MEMQTPSIGGIGQGRGGGVGGGVGGVVLHLSNSHYFNLLENITQTTKKFSKNFVLLSIL